MAPFKEIYSFSGGMCKQCECSLSVNVCNSALKRYKIQSHESWPVLCAVSLSYYISLYNISQHKKVSYQSLSFGAGYLRDICIYIYM